MEDATKVITSLQNPKIKELVTLRKPSSRKENDVVIVEGVKEVAMALQSGLRLLELYVCPEIIKKSDTIKKPACAVVEVSLPVFKKISLRENPDGCLGIFKLKTSNFSDIKNKRDALIVVLETVEKPGNLGAVLRTAEAARVDGVIICNPKTDIYNPNVIRASLGAIFLVPTIVTTNDQALSYLRSHNIKTYAAIVSASKIYTDINWTDAAAIVIGTEHEGLSDFWAANADEHIKIPMFGRIDSLNASVSAAITIYEAVRQRKQIDNRKKK